MIKNPIPRDVGDFNIGEDFDRPIWLAVINFCKGFMPREIPISFLKEEDGLSPSAIFLRKRRRP